MDMSTRAKVKFSEVLYDAGYPLGDVDEALSVAETELSFYVVLRDPESPDVYRPFYVARFVKAEKDFAANLVIENLTLSGCIRWLADSAETLV